MRFNCHTHIFNFRSVFTKETIAILVNRLSREKWPAFATKAAEKLLAQHLKGELLDETAILRELVGALKADQALKDLLKAGTGALPPSLSLALEGDIAGLPVSALKEIIGKAARSLQKIDDNDAGSSDLGDLAAFLLIGLKPSIEAVASQLLEWSGDDTAVVALMMDITVGGNADDALFRRQIEDTAEAVLAYPGRILPFVAVNTRRALHYERMTYALEERGFVGVKLYPSLGYKVDSPEMRRVYAYCEAHATPVLMHCNGAGFFREQASIAECDPRHWEPLLAAFPKLKVCFGHFGGDENLVKGALDADSWTGRILQLMRQHPGQVYADISYHDGPMDGGEAEKNYFQHLQGLLADDAIAPCILFGSDFHLVRQRLHEENLWRFFERRFSAGEFKRITVTNPQGFLGMPRANGTGAAENIVRHLRYLAKYNFEVYRQPADWVGAGIKGAGLGTVTFFPNEFGSGWSHNNEAHYYLDQFFRDLMTAADAAKLTFKECGGLRLRDLPKWPRQSLPDEIRSKALLQIATGLQAFLTQAPEPAAVLEGSQTNATARKALSTLLANPDTRIAAFGPAVDTLYRFKSEPNVA